MGRVRTKTVKKSAKVIIERYYPRLTLDFETNKRICDEIAIIASKRLRNKIAGYTTHLMKRIQRGPVRGISFKLQEEERERKDQYVPEISALDPSHHEGGILQVDGETKDLLKHLGVSLSLPFSIGGTKKNLTSSFFSSTPSPSTSSRSLSPRAPSAASAAATAVATKRIVSFVAGKKTSKAGSRTREHFDTHTTFFWVFCMATFISWPRML